MPIEFKNIKQGTYYIKSKKTKKSNISYFMTRKNDKDCLENLPNGYEVFERYDTGMMYIRKIKKSNVRIEEIKILEKELKNNNSIIDYKLDVNGDEIKIYVAEKEGNDQIFEMFDKQLFSKEQHEFIRSHFKRYEEKMRINLKERKTNREFEVMRYCYRGSIDDWITIDGGENIELLAKENLIHLGKKSYYDLF